MPLRGMHIRYVFYFVSLRKFSLRLNFRLLMHPFGVLHLTLRVRCNTLSRIVAYACTFNAHTRARVYVCAILAESGAL